jgi:hypothetical protein
LNAGAYGSDVEMIIEEAKDTQPSRRVKKLDYIMSEAIIELDDDYDDEERPKASATRNSSILK